MKTERFRAAPTAETQTVKERVEPTSRPPIADNTLITTYCPDEYPIKVVNGKKIEDAFVRVLIGVRNEESSGIYILILSNNKIYITTQIKTGTVASSEELNIGRIVASEAIMKLHSQQIDTLNAKVTKLTSMLETTRRVIGKCTYLVLEDKSLTYLKPNDMDYCFHFGKKRWLYYSMALESWVLLPIGWQKLTYIERFEQSKDKCDKLLLKIGDTFGCLETNKVEQWNGDKWEEIADPVDEFGDEYAVENLITNEGIKPGTLLNTLTGWIYLN